MSQSEHQSLLDTGAMRWLLIILFAVVFVALMGLIMSRIASNPLRKPDTELRAWLFAQTPLGSSSNDVRSILEQRGWLAERYHTTQPRPARDPFLAGDLGGYQGLPWYVFVSAFWEMDASNRLSAIQIRRITDSP